VNVIVAGKQPALQYLSMDEAIVHCTKGRARPPAATGHADPAPSVHPHDR
jgi:xylulose-5-phosphate/fructose-6-phosphate phosphoketolase